MDGFDSSRVGTGTYESKQDRDGRVAQGKVASHQRLASLLQIIIINHKSRYGPPRLINYIMSRKFLSTYYVTKSRLGLAIGTGNVPLGLGALVALIGYIGGVVLGSRIVDLSTVSRKIMFQ